jgi:AcrR family transcriptional regulator
MTRADVIQAAFRAWGRDLYRTTSLRDVAAELGVSKAALYRHFCSKQALLEAMGEWFCDDYAARMRDEHLRAAAADPGEALVILLRGMMRYYAGNAYAFVFSLIYVYGEQRLGSPQKMLARRGVDMGIFARILPSAGSVRAIRMVFATLAFAMAYFHRLGPSERSTGTPLPLRDAEDDGNPGGDAARRREEPEEAGRGEVLERDISLVCCIVFRGLGFQKKEVEVLDYGALERKVSGLGRRIEENGLLHSVAEAVAGAGPWGVSMEMVARVSGLSKSGLYAHFKNKRDMLVRLFATEFDRIIAFAEESARLSMVPAERLYLAIFAIGDYLRSRPDVLIALDWLRTRRIGIPESADKRVPVHLYRIFQGIQLVPEFPGQAYDVEGDWIPAWILFLIVTFLMQDMWQDKRKFTEWLSMPKGIRRQISREGAARIPNETFRDLYRLIVRGIGELVPAPGV